MNRTRYQYVYLAITLTLVCAAHSSVAQQLPRLTPITESTYNLLPATAAHHVFSTASAAVAHLENNAPIINLNGQWHFTTLTDIDRTNPYIMLPKDREWSTIQVPSRWDDTGHPEGQIPTASQSHGADLQDKVAIYQTSVELETAQKNIDYIVTFDRMGLPYHLYINGTFAGYSRTSKSPASYPITNMIRNGTNVITVAMEDYADPLHRHIRHEPKGILGAVRLTQRSQKYILDVVTHSDFDIDQKQALLSLSPRLSNTHLYDYSGARLRVGLYDDGEEVPISPDQNVHTITDEQPITIKIDVADPKKWSPNAPHLYQLVMTLEDAQGKPLDVISQQIGFRTISWTDGAMKLNGQPIILQGVYYDESHFDASAETKEKIISEDIKLMKKNNINAIWLKEPRSPILYDLCNTTGILIAHELPAWDDTRTRPSDIIDISNSIRRHYNHPSIIMWSMKYSERRQFSAKPMSQWIKSLDMRRPFHFIENVSTPSLSSTTYGDILDFVPTRDYNSDAEKANPRPFLYQRRHIKDTDDLMELHSLHKKHPRYAGGFSYNWVETTMAHDIDAASAPRSQVHLPKGCNYSIDNFVVTSDRKPKPLIRDLRKIFQPIKIRLNNDKLTFINEDNHMHSTTMEIHLELLKNGIVARDTSLKTNLPPGKEINIQNPFVTVPDSTESILHVSVHTTADDASASHMHEVAWEQYILHTSEFIAEALLDVSVDTLTDHYMVQLPQLYIKVDRNNGFLTLLDHQKIPLSLSEIKPIFHTVTDLTAQDPDNNPWIDPKMTLDTMYFHKGKKIVSLYTEHSIADSLATQKTIYQLYGTDNVYIKVDIDLKANSSPPSRAGMRILVDDDYDQISYYGRGPSPTCSHTHLGTRFGSYAMSIEDLYAPYQLSGEHSYQYDVRSMDITSHNERIRVDRFSPISISYLQYSLDQLAQAGLSDALSPLPYHTLIIDHCPDEAKKKDSLRPNIAVTFPKVDERKLRYDFNVSFSRISDSRR